MEGFFRDECSSGFRPGMDKRIFPGALSPWNFSSSGFRPGMDKVFFSNSDEISFYPLETKRKTFLLKFNRKISNVTIQGDKAPEPPLSNGHDHKSARTLVKITVLRNVRMHSTFCNCKTHDHIKDTSLGENYQSRKMRSRHWVYE